MRAATSTLFAGLSAGIIAVGVIVVSASTLLVPASAEAEFKLATVDVNRILNESKEALNRRKELQSLSEKAKQKVEAKRKPLEQMESKLRESKAAENSKEAEKYRTEAKSFARYLKDTEEELRREYLKANKALTEDVIEEIRSFAKNHGFEMVLDKSDKLRGPVIFGAASADITESVIKELNN